MTAARGAGIRKRGFLPVAVFVIAIGGRAEALQQGEKNRGDVLKELEQVESKYQTAPGDDENRRAYADLLFELGEFWKADNVIAPLVAASSTNSDDLGLGARLAYLTGDYPRAEQLYARLRAVADEGSAAHTDAAKGLMMVYYLTREYAKADNLTLPEGEEDARLRFMQRFEGTPYHTEWASADKVATVPFITQNPLPLMTIETNGRAMEVILDTGGDMLIVDEGVAKEIGVNVLATRQAKFAYTGGEAVEEGLGQVETIKLGEVTLRNVPVLVLPWKSRGPTSDGVLGTNVLREFLSTVDYANDQMIFREKSDAGKQQLLTSLKGKATVTIPFVLQGSHLMFARGSLNGRKGLSYFIDSGLAASMPFIGINETLEWLGIEKTPIEGTPYSWFPIQSLGLGPLRQGEAQGLADVMVGEPPYWRYGFMFDGLLSHQFLRKYASWTIDFDSMTYVFGIN